MKREALKIITEISFYIALMSLAGMLLTILTTLRERFDTEKSEKVKERISLFMRE
ncbi:hypothetical protein [Rossellomorea vietnamensis]|uniref:hypothetical protein n=1 Tax=Rossellomorea vietnamensis TaxID=218284 RepID=UPI001653AFCC|nr:hypothetical protein [Rossellomorea vietnamensis]